MLVMLKNLVTLHPTTTFVAFPETWKEESNKLITLSQMKISQFPPCSLKQFRNTNKMIEYENFSLHTFSYILFNIIISLPKETWISNYIDTIPPLNKYFIKSKGKILSFRVILNPLNVGRFMQRYGTLDVFLHESPEKPDIHTR